MEDQRHRPLGVRNDAYSVDSTRLHDLCRQEHSEVYRRSWRKLVLVGRNVCSALWIRFRLFFDFLSSLFIIFFEGQAPFALHLLYYSYFLFLSKFGGKRDVLRRHPKSIVRCGPYGSLWASINLGFMYRTR